MWRVLKRAKSHKTFLHAEMTLILSIIFRLLKVSAGEHEGSQGDDRGSLAAQYPCAHRADVCARLPCRFRLGRLKAPLGAGYYCGGGELLCVLERLRERFTLAGLVHEQGTVALDRFLEHLTEARHPRNSGDNSPARLLCRFLGYPVPALQFL